MNSKTSFFNKSVIRSDFKRLWWLSAAETLLLFVCFTFMLLMNLKYRGLAGGEPAKNYVNSELYGYSFGTIACVCVIPVAAAVLLFSYLNSSKAVASCHAMPVKRGTYFSSHMLSGFVLLTLPVLINAAVLLIYRTDPVVASGYRLGALAIWVGLTLLYTAVAFGAATLVCMIAGNNIAAIAFTYVFAGLPVFIEAFVYYFLENHLFGYNGVTYSHIASFLFVEPGRMCENPLNVLKYVLFAIFFIVAAYRLYKARNLENNGEVVAFPKLRPIFVYGVAVAAGMLGYVYINSIRNNHSIFMLIPFGVVGIFGANMLVKKSLNLKSGVKPALIFCIGVCVLKFLFVFDFTGYERKIPSADKVESVVFDNNVNNMGMYTYQLNGKQVKYENTTSALTKREDIENVIKIHEKRITDRKTREDFDDWATAFSFTISYKLKNGKTITHEYAADYNEDRELLKPIIETEEVRHKYFPILNDDGRMLEYIDVCTNSDDGGYTSTTYTDDETLGKIYEALRYDTEHTSYEYFADRERESCFIAMSFKVPAKYTDGTDVAFKDLPAMDETYYVRGDYQKTKELLSELETNK